MAWGGEGREGREGGRSSLLEFFEKVWDGGALLRGLLLLRWWWC